MLQQARATRAPIRTMTQLVLLKLSELQRQRLKKAQSLHRSSLMKQKKANPKNKSLRFSEKNSFLPPVEYTGGKLFSTTG